MEHHLAWQESSDSTSEEIWTLDQLRDQFQQAVTLCGLAGDDMDNNEDDCDTLTGARTGINDHNYDIDQSDANDDSETLDEPHKVSEPFKNKYAARVLLVEMKAALSRQFDRLSSELQNQSAGQLIKEQLLAVSLQLGLIAVSVQEPSTGEDHFSCVVQQLEAGQLTTHPRTVNLCVAAHNQLGLLWAERLDHTKAETELLAASQIYKKYKEENSSIAPVPINDLFSKIEENHNPSDNINTVADEGHCYTDNLGQWSDLEQLHTYTLFYLAQVCGHLGKSADAARYCHATLHRQLADTIVFEPLEWSKNAANLSVYYSGRKNYRMARYLLSSAWAMLSSNSPPCNSLQDIQCRYQTVKAEVGTLIGNYCVKILQDSEAQLEDCSDHTSPTAAEPSISAAAQWEQKNFVGVDPEAVESLESRMPDELVRDYEGARLVFLVGLEHLEKVSSHFTLEDHASRHAETIQSLSRLYQGLAVFEPLPDRQSKMHKRRVDMLSHLLKELNPQFYLQVCRQLRYELAETYAKMATCKEPSNTLDGVSAQQRSKLTSLTLASIDSYKLFLDSFRTASGDLPSRFPEEAERAALVAHFHMGRLWNKMKSSSRAQGVVHITNAISCFKQVMDYVTNNPDSEAKVSEELTLCREMVQLLPVKLAQLQ